MIDKKSTVQKPPSQVQPNQSHVQAYQRPPSDLAVTRAYSSVYAIIERALARYEAEQRERAA